MTSSSPRAADECGRDGKSAGPQRSAKQNTAPVSVHHLLRSPDTAPGSIARATMGDRFEHDFSRIRVHTDAKADQPAERRAIAAENTGNAVTPVRRSASGLQRQQAGAGGGVTLSYARSAPIQGRCGDFNWQIRWNLQGATSATNGFIVQKVKRETLTQHCDDSSDHSFDLYWEAWQVKGGKVLAGMSETQESKGDLFSWSNTMGSKGTTSVVGSAKFMENYTEPFKWQRIKESDPLRGTLQQPAGWSEAGSKYRYIGVWGFSCCDDKEVPGKLTVEELDV